MQTTTAKPFFDRQFWLIGLALVVIAIAAAAAKICSVASENTEGQARAELNMRAAYPELKWAFDEWERCDQGGGDYAKNGYITREQCDLAVLAMAEQRGRTEEVTAAFRMRDESNRSTN